MSILLLSDLKKSTRTIIRGKSKTPKTLPALIIREKKIVQFSKKRPSALIRGCTKLVKLRHALFDGICSHILAVAEKRGELKSFSDKYSATGGNSNKTVPPAAPKRAGEKCHKKTKARKK